MSTLVGAVDAVVRGRNGRLFLGRQQGFDLAAFTSGTALSPSMLAQWRATLLRRGRELSRRGIPYVFMLVPDAPSIHPEDLPDDYPGPHRMIGEIFLQAMGTIPGVTFVHPVAALSGARGGIEVYQRNDSHWTTFGSGVAYRELMATIAPLIACTTVPSSAVRFSYRSSYGDLGSLLDPEVRAEVPVPIFDGREPERISDHQGPQRQTATVTKMRGAPQSRVLAFRDSFMTALSPYLARSFSDLYTVGTTTRVLLDAVDEWCPDLVVSQVAERRLVAFQTDHQLHRHQWMYQSDYSCPTGQAVLRALNLLPDAPSAAATIRSLDQLTLSEPNLAYSAAVVLEAAGDPGAASAFIQPLVGPESRDPAALSFAGKLVLGAGRAGEAASFLGRAVDLAPWNGAYHELLVYALIQDSRPVAAAEAAERAVSKIEDHANLWYWTAVLRDASGRPADAIEAVSRSLALDSGHAAYNALLRRFEAPNIAAP